MEPLSLAQKIEAILFYRGDDVSIKTLTDLLAESTEQVDDGLRALEGSLESRGVRLIREGNMVRLGTAPELASLIEQMRKEELEGPLGKAGLETLAVIAYQGASTRADIEYVRGVNCSSILRTLTMRGLIERTENPKDKRSFVYRPTTELPGALGVTSLSMLPDFEKNKEAIRLVLETRDQEAQKEALNEPTV